MKVPLRERAAELLRAILRGEEVTVGATDVREAERVFDTVKSMLDKGELGDRKLTPEEVERARALMGVERVKSPRSFTADNTEVEAAVGELDNVIEAIPLANGGPCQGDKCRRQKAAPRRAVWALLDLELCDRCAIRKARALDGDGNRMAIPKTRR